MIYVTGDIHGQLDRFKEKALKGLKKKDTLIILGDFGFLWDDSPQERKNLEWIKARPYRVLFLDGCHENFDLLARYPVVDLLGGRAQHLGGSLYHVCRGSILSLENRSLLCLGGGESEDIEDRDEGVNWWRAELPTQEELAACRAALEERDWKVDYILTHDAPAKLLEFMGHKTAGVEQLNLLQVFLNELNDRARYSQWLFGRYHADRRLGRKMQELFCGVVQLESEEPSRGRWFFRAKKAPAPAAEKAEEKAKEGETTPEAAQSEAAPEK